MRGLLYVPIVHEQADLGSAGPSLGQASSALAGEGRWALHRRTVQAFWDNVERYLGRFDPRTVRAYQDGLAADGALGRLVVEEGAKRGSRNYQLLLALLDKGASIRATEDPALLLQEHASLSRAKHQQPTPGQRADLLERRDAYIAERINVTLRAGEVGVLFIGAAHNALGRLASDICVQSVKNPGKLRLYIEELLLGNDSRNLEALARYVAAPVDERNHCMMGDNSV